MTSPAWGDVRNGVEDYLVSEPEIEGNGKGKSWNGQNGC